MTHESFPRSRTELEAARVLLQSGYPAQAISRAYYAAFFAAESALLALGETRSKHSGVISSFGQLVVKDGGVPREIGSLLSTLFQLRLAADYGPGEFTSAEAERSIADAERFVTAVEDWRGRRLST